MAERRRTVREGLESLQAVQGFQAGLRALVYSNKERERLTLQRFKRAVEVNFTAEPQEEYVTEAFAYAIGEGYFQPADVPRTGPVVDRSEMPESEMTEEFKQLLIDAGNRISQDIRTIQAFVSAMRTDTLTGPGRSLLNPMTFQERLNAALLRYADQTFYPTRRQ